MTKFKTKVRNTIAAANPLNNPDFCDVVKRSHLLYNDGDKLPRNIDAMRQIAKVWEDAHCENGQPFELRFNHWSEPNFHAILAEGMACIDMNRTPDLLGSAHSARKAVDMLCRRKLEEAGLKSAFQEINHEYLLAVEQLSKDGFTGKSIFMLAYIVALNWLDTKLIRTAMR